VDLGHNLLVSAGEQVNAGIYQELLRQHMVPGSIELNLTENKPFDRFNASARRQDQPAALARILDSG
jgi:hypothetical protein